MTSPTGSASKLKRTIKEPSSTSAPASGTKARVKATMPRYVKNRESMSAEEEVRFGFIMDSCFVDSKRIAQQPKSPSLSRRSDRRIQEPGEQPSRISFLEQESNRKNGRFVSDGPPGKGLTAFCQLL